MSKPESNRHLSRLDRVWIRSPVYFITTCTLYRRRVLANDLARNICIEVWENARRLYGWHAGQYVIMPDHVHFFCVPDGNAQPLAVFVGKWKEWTAKYLHARAGAVVPLWQKEFSIMFCGPRKVMKKSGITSAKIPCVQDWQTARGTGHTKGASPI